MDLAEFFDADDVAAVRECFGYSLHDLVVDRVLELRIERFDWVDRHERKNLGFRKDGKWHGKMVGWYANGQKWYNHNYRNGTRYGMTICWYSDGTKMYEYHFDGSDRTVCQYNPYRGM